ncbi:MAG: arginine--tRNA ligase [Lachnospiraceae bacterium]|nr:arginine--tRNA ligase [Lachnospiraceae bacterium]
MYRIIDLLSNICGDAFAKAGYDAGFGRVNVSNRPDLCEYQCNGAMALAKKEHKKPIDIAAEVASLLQSDDAFTKVEACMPGFINMDVSASFLAGYLSDMAESRDGGLIPAEHPKRVIVDYGGANAAKPLHVGHLRSAVIGESLKRIGRALGNDMIGDVHLGDWGLQMGLIIEELKDRGQTEFDLKDLEEIYPAASAKSKATDSDGKLTPEAESFRARALHATSLLQSGDPYCIAVWKRIMELSLADLKKNYDALDVHFELWKGESDVQKYIPDMLEDLEKRGIAHESQGALVVDIQEEGDSKELPPCIVRKSDGSALYATTDLATLVEREKLLSPDAYIYVADKRQDLHYLSFFRVAKKAGIVGPDKDLSFLGFGTMNGKDGKPFKTRSGGVMRLEVLIKDISDAVYEKIRATRGDDEISEAEAAEISRIVGLAALKYGDLSNQASKDYVFDIDRFTSFEGNTGPYILYTIVRIGSILHRYGGDIMAAEDRVRQALEASPDAKALALVLTRYNEAVQSAWEQLAPHKICQFIYELSNAFNTFYHNVRILAEEDEGLKTGYIALLSLTRCVLLQCIDMLGFSAPEKM